MTSQLTLLGTFAKEKMRRKSYTRKFKLEVVKYYRENNLYRTSKFYSLTVLRWVKDETKLKKEKKGSKKYLQHFRKAAHPEVEEIFYSEYRELRKKTVSLFSFSRNESEGLLV